MSSIFKNSCFGPGQSVFVFLKVGKRYERIVFALIKEYFTSLFLEQVQTLRQDKIAKRRLASLLAIRSRDQECRDDLFWKNIFGKIFGQKYSAQRMAGEDNCFIEQRRELFEPNFPLGIFGVISLGIWGKMTSKSFPRSSPKFFFHLFFLFLISSRPILYPFKHSTYSS